MKGERIAWQVKQFTPTAPQGFSIPIGVCKVKQQVVASVILVIFVAPMQDNSIKLNVGRELLIVPLEQETVVHVKDAIRGNFVHQVRTLE